MKKVLLSLLAIGCLATGAAGANKTNVKQHQNPFLKPYTTQYGIPPFEKITLDDYIPAIKAGIEQQNQEIAAIVASKKTPDFENTVLALDNCGEILSRVSYVFYALSESDATPEMQKLAEQVSPMLTAQSDAMYMNPGLFARVKAVHDNADALKLDKAQRRLTDKYYKRFVRNGALLDAAHKDTLKAINKRLASLQLNFTQNVMHEIANNLIVVDSKERLSGLPQSTIDDAAKLAGEKGMPGKPRAQPA